MIDVGNLGLGAQKGRNEACVRWLVGLPSWTTVSLRFSRDSAAPAETNLLQNRLGRDTRAFRQWGLVLQEAHRSHMEGFSRSNPYQYS